MPALPPKADIQAISPRISDEHGSARQKNLDFGERARVGIDLDGAAMLLDDDVVADGETEAGPFARGLRREEWIEYLFLHFKRDTGTIVANPDFHTVAKVPGGRYKGRLVIASIPLCTALGCRVEAI